MNDTAYPRIENNPEIRRQKKVRERRFSGLSAHHHLSWGSRAVHAVRAAIHSIVNVAVVVP